MISPFCSFPNASIIGKVKQCLHGTHSLFNLINDLPDIMKHSYIRLFADDYILYKQILSINDAQKLQSDLDSLYL